MRRFFGLTPLVVLGCVGILAAVVPGCDQTTYAQASGYIVPADIFLPRRLVVEFVGTTADKDAAQAIVDPTFATVLIYDDASHIGTVETPLGYSLDEMIISLEALSPAVVSATQDLFLYVDAPAGHVMKSEDGTREVAWLRENGVDLSVVTYEFIVRVTGTFDAQAGAGVGVMDVESMEIVSDHVIQRGGTVSFIDRTADTLGFKVILTDDLRGEAWELVETVAEEIKDLVSPGTLISVSGTELAPSDTSFAGGLSLRVATYAELTDEEADARFVIAEALDDLTYSPSSDIWFLPVEFASGTIVRAPNVFGTTLDASGYLVFIDEDPTAAWPHAAQIVFVKTADPHAPVVIFNDLAATSLFIKNADGEVINGPWVGHPGL